MEPTNRPEWMNDASVKEIPAEKLEFLQKIYESGHGKEKKEIMMHILPMIRRAKEVHLNFTSAELNAAINAIKKYSTDAERSQMDRILSRARKEDPQQ